jgi:flagellar assembly protein FliH
MTRRTRVIKAGQIATVQPLPYNATDPVAKTESQVAKLRSQIDELQRKAQAEAAKLLAAAREQGFRKGYEDGLAQGKSAAAKQFRAEVDQELARRIQTLTPALAEVVAKLVQARDEWIGHWEQMAIRLACAVAGRIVRRELGEPGDVVHRVLAESIGLIGRCPAVTISLNPTDLETLTSNAHEWEELTRPLGTIKVVSEPTVTPGGCRLETDFGTIDATIEAQLARIEQELTGASEDQA